MSISVITPTLNSAATLARTLASVKAQGQHVLEHIVVDGGSGDETLAILRAQDPAFLRFTSEKDAGIASAFNKGVRAAKGDWIAILNADDWFEDGALAHYANHPDFPGRAVIFHGRMRVWDAAGEKVLSVGGPEHYDPAQDFNPYRRMPGYHPTCLVPRRVFLEHGLFSEAFRTAMDYEFLFRCHMAGVQFRYVPEIIANFREGGLSGRTEWLAVRERLAARLLSDPNVYRSLKIYATDLWKLYRRERKAKRLAIRAAEPNRR